MSFVPGIEDYQQRRLTTLLVLSVDRSCVGWHVPECTSPAEGAGPGCGFFPLKPDYKAL